MIPSSALSTFLMTIVCLSSSLTSSIRSDASRGLSAKNLRHVISVTFYFRVAAAAAAYTTANTTSTTTTISRRPKELRELAVRHFYSPGAYPITRLTLSKHYPEKIIDYFAAFDTYCTSITSLNICFIFLIIFTYEQTQKSTIPYQMLLHRTNLD